MKTNWTKQDLKECIGLHTEIAWKEVPLEITYSASGVGRGYINGYKLPFYASGYGYDKTSTVLADFMSYYTNDTSKEAPYSCCGIDTIKDYYKEKHSITIKSYSTKDGYLFIIKTKDGEI